MPTTPNLDLPTVPNGQTNLSVAFNLAMQILDAVAQCSVEAFVSDPPVTTDADIGRMWLVGAAPTGAFAGKANQLAIVTGASTWSFYLPGDQIKYVLNEGDQGFYKWDGMAWSLAGGLPDAVQDGKTYGRRNGVWVEVESSGDAGIPEAPSDGSLYARKDGAWAGFTPGTPEAPNDGKQYARKNLGWVEVVSSGGGGGIPEAPLDGKQYARKDGAWSEVVAGGDVARSLVLTTTGTDDPYAKYASWETLYGFPVGGNDYPSINTVTDDAAFIMSIGGQQKSGFPPVMTLGSEGHLGYEFPGSPTNVSAAPAPLPPNTNRAYWSTGPHPRKLICFHPDGTDAETRECIAKYTPDGVIIRGMVAYPRGSNASGVKFAAKFVGGSWELYLQNGLANAGQVTFMFLDVGGPDPSVTYAYIGDHPVIPAGGFLKAEYK